MTSPRRREELDTLDRDLEEFLEEYAAADTQRRDALTSDAAARVLEEHAR